MGGARGSQPTPRGGRPAYEFMQCRNASPAPYPFTQPARSSPCAPVVSPGVLPAKRRYCDLPLRRAATSSRSNFSSGGLGSEGGRTRLAFSGDLSDRVTFLIPFRYKGILPFQDCGDELTRNRTPLPPSAGGPPVVRGPTNRPRVPFQRPAILGPRTSLERSNSSHAS